jgi:hypothetical protein
MFVDDLHHAMRRLRAQPGSAAVAAVMLALAIAITSAMFTIVATCGCGHCHIANPRGW